MIASDWTATIRIAHADPTAIDRLARALAPEAGREVPRARARLERTADGLLLLHITTKDTGALRAALNTFLGWVDLASSTERVAASAREQ
ncbi:MAG: CTAG/PCC1 family protein [Thermoplasmata archaeon]|nr:CTAG/PCC1 family protein [Thermoplasmata archaeon]